MIALDAPRAVVANDTLEARVTVRAGELAVRGATLSLVAGSDVIATMPIDSLGAGVERTLTMRGRIQGAVRSVPLAAIVSVPGDVEHRNDTLAMAVQVAPAAGAVLASTSPDFDARFLIPVLRGAVALPTRAYYRVAPGMWRQDGTLAAVSEASVRAALAEAPLAIVHGDTALFGAPRAVTKGSLLLYAPSADTIGEWYPAAAPTSPIAAMLSGVPWDSLAPLSVSRRRARRLDRPARRARAQQRATRRDRGNRERASRRDRGCLGTLALGLSRRREPRRVRYSLGRYI